jgi:hypothetical protein
MRHGFKGPDDGDENTGQDDDGEPEHKNPENRIKTPVMEDFDGNRTGEKVEENSDGHAADKDEPQAEPDGAFDHVRFAFFQVKWDEPRDSARDAQNGEDLGDVDDGQGEVEMPVIADSEESPQEHLVESTQDIPQNDAGEGDARAPGDGLDGLLQVSLSVQVRFSFRDL